MNGSVMAVASGYFVIGIVAGIIAVVAWPALRTRRLHRQGHDLSR